MDQNRKKVMTASKKLRRGILWLLYYLLARHLPRSHVKYSFGSRAIRAFVLKGLFKKFGEKVNIEPKVIFFNLSESEIGDYSGIGMYSYVGTVKIGRDVMIGEELIAISRNHAHESTETPMRLQGFQTDRPITIENDVWIGSRVILLPGITVGKGSIIGAGSVVTKNVSPYTIVAGNPATVIRKR
jgi:maltose O-acetyltransferase